MTRHSYAYYQQIRDVIEYKALSDDTIFAHDCVRFASGVIGRNLTQSDDILCQPHITRRDTTRQLPTRKSCNVRGSTTRQDKNRASSQISSIVRSLTTRPEFCLVVSRRVVYPRTLHDFLVGSCRVVSCRVVSCNVRCALPYQMES